VLLFITEDGIEELPHDSCRCPPDNPPLVFEAVVEEPFTLAGMHLHCPPVFLQKGLEGNLDQLRDLLFVYGKGIRVGDLRDDRGNEVPREDGEGIIQFPQNPSIFPGQANFLEGFPQGSGLHIFISLINNTSGKGNLPLMVFHPLGPFGEEDVRATSFFEKRDEHRRPGPPVRFDCLPFPFGQDSLNSFPQLHIDDKGFSYAVLQLSG